MRSHAYRHDKNVSFFKQENANTQATTAPTPTLSPPQNDANTLTTSSSSQSFMQLRGSSKR